MALSFLPYLIGGALLGAAADRLPARRVLVACDLASAALIGCMVIPGVPLPGLLALLFAIGLIAPVYQGVRSAVLPEVLPPGPAAPPAVGRWPATPSRGSGKCSPTGRPGGSCCSAGWCPRAWSRPRPWPLPTPRTSASPPGLRGSC